ncbi:MAG: hypothetical protein AABY16_00520 [Nanoarchaeota archaeon]
MGFKEFFRLTKGKLIFVFALLFVALVLILLQQYVFISERYLTVSIYNWVALWVFSFPGLVLLKPLGFLIFYGGKVTILGYFIILFIDFIFWYTFICFFAWLNKITTRKNSVS